MELKFLLSEAVRKKIDFENEWVHLRSSNTEPIIRIYTEATSQAAADKLADDIISIIGTIK